MISSSRASLLRERSTVHLFNIQIDLSSRVFATDVYMSGRKKKGGLENRNDSIQWDLNRTSCTLPSTGSPIMTNYALYFSVAAGNFIYKKKKKTLRSCSASSTTQDSYSSDLEKEFQSKIQSLGRSPGAFLDMFFYSVQKVVQLNLNSPRFGRLHTVLLYKPSAAWKLDFQQVE